MIKRWIPILCVFATAMLADTLTLATAKRYREITPEATHARFA